MKTLVLLMTLALGTPTFAHSGLASSTPPDGSTVRERPATVSLTFGEAVEPRFSTFAVVPLDEAGVDPEALFERVLSGSGGEQVAARVVTEEASETVSLSLPDDLAPGRYAVLWRTVSVDTHTAQNMMVFTYQP